MQTVLVEQAKRHGLSVITAADRTTAMSTVEMAAPDIVAVDLDGSDGDSMRLLTSIRAQRPTCAVIVIADAARRQTALDALRAGAVDMVAVPVVPEEFSRAIHRALSTLPRTVDEAAAIEQMEHAIVVIPDPAEVDTVAEWLIQTTGVMLPATQRLHLRAMLHELILNAIEHGSLDVHFREKEEALARDRYDELLRQRMEDPRYKRRRITVRVLYDKRQRVLQYRITDEGKGFQWKNYLNRTMDSCPAGESNGRGIFLARSFFPNLTYNDRGNEATVTIPLT
jgi:DNA-binding response OmpR family regulator